MKTAEVEDVTGMADEPNDGQDILAALDELTPEEMQTMEEALIAQQQKELEMREQLAQVLAKHRDDAVRYRHGSGIEQQWSEDQAYYEGRDESSRSMYYKGMTTAAPLIAKRKSRYRSKVFLNITRPYVETAASKVIEVLCPTDAASWMIKPTSIPSIPEEPSVLVAAAQAQQTQQPLPQEGMQQIQQLQPAPIDELEDFRKRALASAKGAQIWIEDKLEECHFQAALRGVVDEASLLGTGVLRGPVPMSKVTTKTDAAGNIIVVEEILPVSSKISVWDAFPDPACGDDIHNGQFFIEHDRMVEKQVLDLKQQPGYIDDAIDHVIAEGPKGSMASGLVSPPYESNDQTAERFHVWYYTGFLKREEVMAMQCKCEDSDEIKNIGVPVIITMINNTPVKAHLNPDPTGKFPYDFMCWQKIAGSPFGIGIARQIRACQSILNSHVRAMMENAGLCSGPQIVIARGSVAPADGSWEVTPRKVWFLKIDADSQNVGEAMNSFTIPSVQQELLQAIDFALKMAENVTGLPILLQGQQGPNGVPETLGGMQILVANASSLVRRIARIFDDSLITPHIMRYYVWMMNYVEDQSIKGDFKIVALGSTALVARDQRNTFLTQTCPQYMANPAFGIDPSRLFKKIAKANGENNPEEIMFSAEEMKVMQQNAQPDPRVQVAQLTTQTKLQTAQMDNETRQASIARDTDRDTKYVEAETQRTQVTAQVRMEELKLKRELAMLEYANREKLSLNTIKAQLAITASKNDLQREIATLPKPEDIAKGLNDAAAAPVIEPPGKAPAGYADSL